MQEPNYSKRELDAKFQAVTDSSDENRTILTEKIENAQNVLELRLSSFEHDTRDWQQRAEVNQNEVLNQVKFTNGKVRKLIIGSFLVGGILIGQVFSNWHDIITLLVSLV